jgi:hypothetical protein
MRAIPNPSDRINVWRHQQAFLGRYLQSPTGGSSASVEDLDPESAVMGWILMS